MITLVNFLNRTWNYLIAWFHDASVQTNVRWLINLSVWAYDRLMWRLSDEWQLINGIPFKEFMLQRELEVAQHQIRYYADYACDLQRQNLFLVEEEEKTPSRKKTKQKPDSGATVCQKQH